MIQRIQSLFLILVDVVLIALLFVPYAYYMPVVESPAPYVAVTLLDQPALLIGQIILSILAITTLAMFKNRPLQMKLCLAGIVLSLLYSCLLAYNNIFPVVGVHWEIGPGTWISLGNALMFILARIFIKKDDELVKSVDRLR